MPASDAPPDARPDALPDALPNALPNALIEFGIGETRAVVLDRSGRIVEAHVERDDDPWRHGEVAAARLTTILVPGVRGIARDGARDGLVTPLPRDLTEGAAITVMVMREAVAEAGRDRLAKLVVVAAAPCPGPGLAERLRARGLTLATVAAFGRDAFEDIGWTEAVEAAASGIVAFPGGTLTISPTPAMTVIDVDGALPPAELAAAAADAVAAAIRRFDLGGSIGVDFPTLGDRALRTRLGLQLDAALPPPFERTAVNGFGFVQIVRPRLRPSLVERQRGSPVASVALRLLRIAERSGGIGPRTLTAAPRVTDWLAARPHLVAELERRLGVAVRLRADPALAMSVGHVAATA